MGKNRKLQFGLDLGFLNDKIIFNVNYIRNYSSNQLLRYQLPSITGQTFVDQNFPATILNTSFEFAISASNLKIGRLNWSGSFNLTIPKNKVVDFPNIENSTYAGGEGGVIIGHPLNVQKSVPFHGSRPRHW